VATGVGPVLAGNLSKQNPQAIGALGGFRLSIKAASAHWGVGGLGYTPKQFRPSRAVLRATIGLWCNAIARWYAAVLSGRPNVRSACLALLGGHLYVWADMSMAPPLALPSALSTPRLWASFCLVLSDLTFRLGLICAAYAYRVA
jgi:hypothetical protein